MYIGDIVRYKTFHGQGPMGIIIAISGNLDSYHGRIRVMWSGNELPIQSRICSVKKNSKITTWMKPNHFEKVLKI